MTRTVNVRIGTRKRTVSLSIGGRSRTNDERTSASQSSQTSTASRWRWTVRVRSSAGAEVVLFGGGWRGRVPTGEHAWYGGTYANAV